MTTVQQVRVRDRTAAAVYVGRAAADVGPRHLSLFPFVRGLEACCGQALLSTQPVPWVHGLVQVTCAECRSVGKGLGVGW